MILFVREERTLITHIDQILDYKQATQASLRTFTFLQHPLLPGMSNRQIQMAAGMADMPSMVFWEGKLIDGLGTSLGSRPLAVGFKNFLHENYPQLSQEPHPKAFLVFFNVLKGMSQDADKTLVNDNNLAVGMHMIQKILAQPMMRNAKLKIITSDEGQATKYIAALKELQAPEFEKTKFLVRTLSQLQGKVRDIVIVDLVREEQTFETQFLRQALTLHRDGLIIIGNAAEDSNQSSALIQKWFRSNGRVVDVSADELSRVFANPFGRPPSFQGQGLKRKAVNQAYPNIRSKRVSNHRGYFGTPGSASQRSFFRKKQADADSTVQHAPRAPRAMRSINREVEAYMFLASLSPHIRLPSTNPAPRSARAIAAERPSVIEANSAPLAITDPPPANLAITDPSLAMVSPRAIAAERPSAIEADSTALAIADPPPAPLADTDPPLAMVDDRANLPQMVANRMTRYRAIRNLFASLHDTHDASPEENLRFRYLAEALHDGKDNLFESSYNQLMRSAMI